MANKAKEKTTKQKATAAAYATVEKAREAHTKQNNASTKSALQHAESEYEKAKNAERRERFVTVGNARAAIVLAKIGALAKCSNRRGYEFSKEDIDKLETVMGEAMESCMNAFHQALAGKAPATGGAKTLFE